MTSKDILNIMISVFLFLMGISLTIYIHWASEVLRFTAGNLK